MILPVLLVILALATTACGLHSGNTRYLKHASGAAIYLTGSHTWPNLIERNTNPDPASEPFDFRAYLKLLSENNHNFIRLWSRHTFQYPPGCYSPTLTLYSDPLPWARTGPGTALDGKPKFNLNEFNQDYFSRLRQRVVEARNFGIYVGIMLFGGVVETKCWSGSPFNIANNSSGINGDTNGDSIGDIQRLPLPPGVDTIQKSYIRKIIDVVGDLDNVLFEVSNESRSDTYEWQTSIIKYVKDYGSGGKQRAVGMTAFYDTRNDLLFNSIADWISPGAHDSNNDPYFFDPPAADGTKLSILDSDHVFYEQIINNPLAGRNWVWKSFTRGHNPILMENIFADSTGGAVPVTLHDAGFTAARVSMGQTRWLANQMNLAAMVPRGDLSSTRYALVNVGSEYLIYQPDAQVGSFTLDVVAGSYISRWFEPETGNFSPDEQVTAPGGPVSFSAPFSGDAVLWLRSSR